MKKRNKYGAVPTEVDGIRFHSKGEAGRWLLLRQLEKGGLIKNLERQIKFPLEVSTPGAGPKVIGNYYADFRYWEEKRGTVVEDFKGYATPLYRHKKKHVEAQYGIEITEVK